ncbi:hypothetical protein ACFQU7_25880 [Pseudoroseomonas wenyumeiae]
MGQDQGHRGATIAAATPAANASAPVAARLLGEGPVPVWSMPSSELLRRALTRAKVPVAGAGESAALLLRADHVYDAALVGQMARSPAPCCCGPRTGGPLPRICPPGPVPPRPRPWPRRCWPAPPPPTRPSPALPPPPRRKWWAPMTRRCASAAPPMCWS